MGSANGLRLIITSILLISGLVIAEEDPGSEGTSIDVKDPGITPTRTPTGSDLDVEFDDPYFEVKANQYVFPLNLSDVEGYSLINFTCKLNSTEVEFLRQHGYVNLGDSGYYDIIDLYHWIRGGGFPTYVTTDSMLHVYHILFDELLKDIEEDHLYDLMYNFTASVLARAIATTNSLSGKVNVSHYYRTLSAGSPVAYLINETLDLKEIAIRNVIYLSVALRLLNPYASIPSWVQSEVTAELDLINSHSGLFKSPLMDKSDVHPILTYYEDYTQYVPRGHYTRSQRLENYFKAMMWFGRITFRQKSAEETMQAVILSDSIQKAKFGNEPATDLWNKTYLITSFFVGWSDDLTYEDHLTLSNIIYGNITSTNTKLKDASRLVLFMDYLDELRKPKINSHFFDPLSETMENATLGLRLMGQRMVPDSYIFQELVYPNVGDHTGTGTPFTLSYIEPSDHVRGFPRGMDVMAVLGNRMAETYLVQGGDTGYVNYTSQFARLKAEFDSFGNDTWGSNLYWGWLHTLSSLNENFTAWQYPTYMRDNGYLAERLNTALGSWTELRHDTVLYAEQSNPGGSAGPRPKSYAEPIPVFYSRLRALTNATRDGLEHLNVLGTIMKNNLGNLSYTLLRLEDISIKQLENRTISADDYMFLDYFDLKIEDILKKVPRDTGDVRMIVDVHTDPNMDPSDMELHKCLEEAVGNFDMVVVIRNDTDGQLRSAIGPVFSYYEFKTPASQRMTDDDWRTGLATGNYEVHKFNWMDYPENMERIVTDIPAYSDISVTREDISLSFQEVPVEHFEVDARINVRNHGKTDVTVDVRIYLGSMDPEDLRGTYNIHIDAGSAATILYNWTVSTPVNPFEKLYVTVEAGPDDDMNKYNNMAMNFLELVADPDYDDDLVLNDQDRFPFDPSASMDTDGDGYPDSWNPGKGPGDSTTGLRLDAFPLDPEEWSDRDGDGHGDNSDMFPDDPLEWKDSDNDGVGDNSDLFPDDPSEWNDSDGDEYGDNSDAFPYDKTEWSDRDGDEHGDRSDVFPDDPKEWMDSDRDGYGDNSDAFPFDPTEWFDSDDDGYGDNSDLFPDDPLEWYDTDYDGRGDNSDAFPDDRSEWSDMDGDGQGDNSDMFPKDPNEWSDLDKDGVGDNSDVFPRDTNEWSDLDGDGCGDNQDRFPRDPNEWSDIDNDGVGDFEDRFPEDPNEWSDLDGDDVGDNSDAFPNDPAASVDTDGDGYPDRWNPGRSEKDSTTGLKLDMYPDDEKRFEDPEFSFKYIRWMILGVVILLAIPLSVAAVIYRSRSNNASKRISTYKRNSLNDKHFSKSMMSDSEIIFEASKKRDEGSLSEYIYEDIINEFGIVSDDED